MLDMNDRIADPQLGQIAHHRLDVRRALARLRTQPARAGRIQFGFGEDREVRVAQHEAAVQRPDPERKPRIRSEKGAEIRAVVVNEGERQRVLAQHLRHRLAPAVRVRQQQHAATRACDIPAQAQHRVVGFALHRDRGRWRKLRRVAFAKCQPCMRLGGGEELLRVHEQARRRQARPLAITREKTEALIGFVQKAPAGRLDRSVQNQVRVSRHIVEQGRRRVEEQRQVVLDARAGNAVADVLVDARPAWVALECLAPTAAKGRACRFVDWKLAPGQEPDLRNRIQAALRIRIERANRLDRIVEQIESIRQRRAHRE